MSTTLLRTTLLSITLLSPLFTKEITLQEAIQTALENNQKKKISALDIKIAQAQYKQALSANFPSLDLQAGIVKRDEELINITKGEFTLSQDLTNALALASVPDSQKPKVEQLIKNNLLPPATIPLEFTSTVMGDRTAHAALTLTYPLYSGGKISALQEQAKFGKEIAQQNDARTKEEIIFDVKKYFYTSQLTQNISQLMHDTSERMMLLNDLTKEMFENGSQKVKKTDYYKTQLASSMFQALDKEYQSKATLSKSALLFAMGEDPQSELSLKENFTLSKQTNLPSLAELIHQAYQQNKQLLTLQSALKIYQAKIKEAKSGYKPNIALFGSVEHTDNNYDGGMSNSQNDDAWSIGVGASWNLFNGLRTTAQVEEAKLQLLKLKEQEKRLKQAISLQIKKSYTNYQSKTKEVEILSKAVITAQKNRDLNTRAYQMDMVETKDVIEAQVNEAQIKAKYYKSLYDKLIAQATLDLVSGK